MSTSTMTAAPSNTSTTLTEKTVCLQLRIGGLGTRTRVDSDDIDAGDADKEMVHVHKDILQSEELKAVRVHANELRRYVQQRALPSILRGGIYLWPIALVPQLEQYLAEQRVVRKGLVEQFIAVYPQKIEEARAKLGKLFREDEYPTAARVRKAFSLDVRYLTFSTPSSLKEISQELFNREQKKHEQRWSVAYDEITNLLRAEFKQLVDHWADRLSTDAEGKKKVFRNTMVTNLHEFIESFNPRNVTGDAELAALVEKAKKLASGVDADTLRDSDSLRAQTQAAFAEIKAKVDTMVVDRPKRLITFDDEEE